jgi:Chaperonin 10 Kd subunit
MPATKTPATKTRFRPLHDRVLVKRLEEEVRYGEIILPDTAKEKPQASTSRGKTVNVEVKPPKEAPAGEYPITVPVSSGPSAVTKPLTVVLTGIYKLEARTPRGVLSTQAVTGQPTTVSLLVQNTGSAVNRNIELTPIKPENWEVKFEPEKDRGAGARRLPAGRGQDHAGRPDLGGGLLGRPHGDRREGVGQRRDARAGECCEPVGLDRDRPDRRGDRRHGRPVRLAGPPVDRVDRGTTAMDFVIETHELTKRYGAQTAVDLQDVHRLGRGVEFMRVFAEEIYGIPPEQIVGSVGETKLEVRNGKAVLVKLPKINLVDDKAGKPVGIHRFIGRRPVLAFGNSDGDHQMLQWTAAGDGLRFMGLVRHTDAEREWAYDRQSSIGRLDKALDEATQRGGTAVDMKQDWKVIYPFQR